MILHHNSIDFKSHPLLRNNEKVKSFISCCLTKDPMQRWTATKLLMQHPWILEMNDHILKQTMADD